MFEYDQAIVDTLLHDNQRFQELYKQHHDLKKTIDGSTPSALPPVAGGGGCPLPGVA